MPTWKTLDDAARKSGVSRRQIQRWIHDKKVTGYKRSGDRHVYVDLDDIEGMRRYEPLPAAPRSGKTKR